MTQAPSRRKAVSARPGRTLRGRARLGAGAFAIAAVVAGLTAAAAVGATVEDKTSFAVTAGSLSFSTTPAMPTLTSVTLNGEAQKTNTTMTSFGVSDATGSGSGWNVTVNGQSGSEKSAVFAQYCPNTTCGTDVKGYVPAGATLPANSLTLSSTGATFAAQKESTGTAPELKCASACNVDSAAAVKIASAALNAGMGTWLAEKWSGTSLTLSTPTTLKALANAEVYRVNLLWTLSTGP
jgi:hypothetical protein